MVIDSFTAGKLVRLRANLKEDEKIVSRGAILEVAKKTKWEMFVSKIAKFRGWKEGE
jgi:hypothetical protein